MLDKIIFFVTFVVVNIDCKDKTFSNTHQSGMQIYMLNFAPTTIYPN